MNKSENIWWKILIVILVVVLIIAFIASFGKWDFKERKFIPVEFTDSKEEAKRKHKELSEQLNKDEALNEKLTRIYKRMYFSVRVAFVLFWAGILYYLHIKHLVNNLSDVLNYSEAMILICLGFNFLTFGTIANLKDFTKSIQIKLENWIWRNNQDLVAKIEINKVLIKKFAGNT
jgi:cytochrome c biogenesis protein CcdA